MRWITARVRPAGGRRGKDSGPGRKAGHMEAQTLNLDFKFPRLQNCGK